MPIFVILAVAIATLSVGLLTWVIGMGPDRTRQRILGNLQRGFAQPETQQLTGALPTEQPGALATLARRFTPNSSVQLLDRLHGKAGRPAEWTTGKILVLKPVLAVIAASLSLAMLGATAHPLFIAIALIATPTCYFLPELLLYSRGIERSEAISLEVADTLDQMTIAVEAGLGFDSAMARAGQNGSGPLAEELVRTLQDIQMGQSRRQAFEALARRSDVPELRRFIRAVIQADNYGISISDVLRTQAREMRVKRRQRAEEKAMQIPVKVIFPLMLCILPVLFIVLLGPVAIQMIGAFS